MDSLTERKNLPNVAKLKHLGITVDLKKIKIAFTNKMSIGELENAS
jgi:hypothetical protein